MSGSAEQSPLRTDVETTQASADVSPRVLLEVTIYRPGTDTVDHTAWTAVQPQGVVSNGRGYDREIIGFAEFPRNEPIGRSTDAETFTDLVNEKSVYVHWKTTPSQPSGTSQ